MPLDLTDIVEVAVWGHDAVGLPHLSARTILVHILKSIHLNQGSVGTKGILHVVDVTTGPPPSQVVGVIARDKIWSHNLIALFKSFPGPRIGDTHVLLEQQTHVWIEFGTLPFSSSRRKSHTDPHLSGLSPDYPSAYIRVSFHKISTSKSPEAMSKLENMP